MLFKAQACQKAFILQYLANDSAQPQKTLRPRWSTPQTLKRDSYPQKTPTKTCSSTGGPAALPGRSPSYGDVGRDRFQGRKTQAILASPGWASTVAGLPHCSITKTSVQLLRTSPRTSATLPKVTRKRAGAIRLLAPTGSNSRAKKTGRLAAPKMGPRNGPSSRKTIWN